MASTSGQRYSQNPQGVAFAGRELRFSLKANILHDEMTKEETDKYAAMTVKKKKEFNKQKKLENDLEWRTFLDKFLRNVCGARNTPDPGSNSRLQLPRKNWWRLEIELENKKEDFNYKEAFSDKVDDDLCRFLSLRSSFPNVFLMVLSESKIALHVASSVEDFFTHDYKTKQTTNKGLLPRSTYGLDHICYDLYKKEEMNLSISERCSDLKDLKVGKILRVSEDARLQFKCLKKGNKVSFNKLSEGQEEECFDPEQPADHWADWIWNKTARGLGEYVSVFSKIEEGGAIYYGINVTKDKTAYEPEGLPIDDAKQRAVKEEICYKIRKDMLWIQSDPDSSDGYRELKPEDIRCQGETTQGQERCHFAVDFIKVLENEKDPHEVNESSSETKAKVKTASGTSRMTGQVRTTDAGKATSEPAGAAPPSQAKYVLEVRVAPFNGVVFYDPQGPEAYRMQEDKGQFQPVRVSKKQWLAKLRDHGWCSVHTISKETQCKLCQP